MTNEYGNAPIKVGVGHSLEGVQLYGSTPDGEPVRLLQLEPEFAREIAACLTMASFECEDARGEAGPGKSSGG